MGTRLTTLSRPRWVVPQLTGQFKGREDTEVSRVPRTPRSQRLRKSQTESGLLQRLALCGPHVDQQGHHRPRTWAVCPQWNQNDTSAIVS